VSSVIANRLWKKAFGLAKSEELMKVVESVANDPGTAAKP